jgi:GTP-binding protein HflX
MHQPTAVVAARTATGAPDTTEITRLVAAAGYEVVGALTQRRPEDPALQFGRGKVAELTDRVADTGADAVVFDNRLTPTQAFELADRLPDGVAVLDRRRLVLDIFAGRAGTRLAALQTELATLRYELPRRREARRRELDGELAAHDEDGKRIADLERRIDELRRKLDEAATDDADRRERRREEGFDLVALAGYTNAGKSTLLHRVADGLDLNDDAPTDDLDAVASIEDRLFETLQTTTRRATVGGRRLLVTDTVGLVDALSHEFVQSFHGTLGSVADADLTLVVVDASDPIEEVRRKAGVARESLPADGDLLPVLNKVDLLDDGGVPRRNDVVGGVFDREPVAISAREGSGFEALRSRVLGALPTERADLRLPNSGEAMSLRSWAHDRVRVVSESYDAESVALTVAGNPRAVERVRHRAAGL